MVGNTIEISEILIIDLFLNHLHIQFPCTINPYTPQKIKNHFLGLNDDKNPTSQKFFYKQLI